MDITTAKRQTEKKFVEQGAQAMNMDIYMTILKQLKAKSSKIETIGLNDKTIQKFLSNGNKQLASAIELASKKVNEIEQEFPEVLKMPEKEQIAYLQADFVNFYLPETVNPYVALAACGPWIITTCGAVVHDSGGYGMLGAGHTPENVIDAMAEKQVMANIMTANFSQLRFTKKLKKEIGHTRQDKSNLFEKFICMNSGSEAVTVAARISDVLAKTMTDKNGKHEGKTVKALAIKGGFHGRTDRPSQFSDSSMASYKKHLNTFSKMDNLVTIRPNNIEDLENAFKQAEKDNVYFEAMLMEPVMGEGDPGMAVTPAFYRRARELTAEAGTLLVVDSIQAGLRTQGVLSIIDYPGFQELPCPDLETYSKALNAGQYPFSVLALNNYAANLYVAGIYGNTMTTNPRALTVASTVLDSMTDSLRKNIRDKGQLFLDKLNELKAEFPKLITHVQGTGLLFSAEVADGIKVVGFDGLEQIIRRNGVGVIHGGANSLRFTPHFAINDDEVDLVIDVLRDTFKAIN
ncbi:aminotransferase class III-fold pyridoxal phosphate-dependent enzyme [Francisellaceae bacterium]|nr:aminotransferase class III-fold pyridoxal phosphate-dependent enzyme [Francisellaceae bacterium]